MQYIAASILDINSQFLGILSLICSKYIINENKITPLTKRIFFNIDLNVIFNYFNLIIMFSGFVLIELPAAVT
ncbi:hypothetical protein SAMN04488541_11112 [Thermoflexibacter ruber]|uniref:Uncharacterized protein n=1 Tax=Thermoflexibacter ruber TaxID=1003 RepID=A0A1I2KCF4_9BACT|nr:hypothetical protein SAMN04488541_11112 [Thermoflexibacter ruber]